MNQLPVMSNGALTALIFARLAGASALNGSGGGGGAAARPRPCATSGAEPDARHAAATQATSVAWRMDNVRIEPPVRLTGRAHSRPKTTPNSQRPTPNHSQLPTSKGSARGGV